jgi:hypothetical protein
VAARPAVPRAALGAQGAAQRRLRRATQLRQAVARQFGEGAVREARQVGAEIRRSRLARTESQNSASGSAAAARARRPARQGRRRLEVEGALEGGVFPGHLPTARALPHLAPHLGHHLPDLEARVSMWRSRPVVKGLFRPRPSSATVPGAVA